MKHQDRIARRAVPVDAALVIVTARLLCACLTWIAAAVLPGAASSNPAGAARPNFLVIVADDLGWGDVG